MLIKKNVCRKVLHYFFSLFFLFTIISVSNCDAQKRVAQKRGGNKIAVNKNTGKRIFYGQASFYSNKFNGRQTASGEIFSQKKMTCACNVLPIGSWIKVTNLRNGKSAIVKVNDRLHPSMKRVVDLTRAGAQKLGFVSAGLTRVRVDLLGKKKPE
jgi:rare lipoprotein A